MTEITRRRLRELLEKQDRKATDVAVEAGLKRTYLYDFLEGRVQAMGADKVAAIADVLGVTVGYLAGREELRESPKNTAQAAVALQTDPVRDVPVYGTAAGAAAGAIALSNDSIEWLPRPPGLRGARDVYALYVVGSSMEPRWRPGDVLFVHPHRPVRRGDHVVIQIRNHDGAETQSWVKEFVRTNAAGDIVAHQYNPAADVTFARATVKAIHRVLTTNELFGV